MYLRSALTAATTAVLLVTSAAAGNAAGTNLYALGVFTTVNGKSAPRIARFQG